MDRLPRHERPRERLLSHGADVLSDRELLALVLRNGRPGESAIDIAAALIAEHGGLGGLAAARPEELARRPGIGPAKAAAVLAALRLGRRSQVSGGREVVRTAEDLAAVACRELRALRRERAIVVILDSGHRVVRVERLGEGSVDRLVLPVREVLNAVLRHDGRAFAVAHNHPTGVLEASPQDVAATRDLAAAAKIVGLRLLDHVIVTEEGWVSLRTEGVLK